MNYRIVQGDMNHAKVDALIFLVSENDLFSQAKHSFPNSLEILYRNYLTKTQFKGKFLEARSFSTQELIEASEVIIIGLGEIKKVSPARVRSAMAKAIKQAQQNYHTKLAVGYFTSLTIDPKKFGQVITEGGILGNYKFTRYQTIDQAQEEAKRVKNISLYTNSSEFASDLQSGITHGLTTSQAIIAIRDLINEPPGSVTPKQLASFADAIGKSHSSIKVTCYDRDYLKKEGYEALLAVASGSDEPPYLIHLEYKPPIKTHKNIAFVGKGVTFDSGGLGIKPPMAMRSMKADMAGAGTVLGIFLALGYQMQADHYVPYHIHGIIPTTENMISGKAMRPDDIIKTKQGKTIEVAHTDAEGRLILADALIYAQALKPDAIIDFATLTGSAIVALGRHIAAYMGNDESLLKEVESASRESGELAWELPLHQPYSEYLKSSIADIQNIATASSSPDAILGGLFLQEFISDVPWVHMDIAGPSWQEEDTDPLVPKGASGWGVLLLDSLLNKFP